jgi:hypothetical protein
MVKSIDIIVDEDGKIRLTVGGIIGSLCVDESDKVLKALRELGVDVAIEQDTRLPEFYLTKEKAKVKL